MKDFRLLYGGIFSGAGVCALIAGVVIGTKTYSFTSRAERTAGKVARVDLSHSSSSSGATYCPVFAFSLEGKNIEFSGSTCSNPTSFRAGESVEILYDPRNPHNAKVNSPDQMWFDALILLFLGFNFSMFGGFLLQRYYVRERLKKWLTLNGKSLFIKISQVRPNTQTSFNDKNPFVIECQWTDESSGRIITAVSDDLWFNPDISGHAKVGSEIEVLVDPQDPDRNYIKIDHLKKVAA